MLPAWMPRSLVLPRSRILSFPLSHTDTLVLNFSLVLPLSERQFSLYPFSFSLVVSLTHTRSLTRSSLVLSLSLVLRLIADVSPSLTPLSHIRVSLPSPLQEG